MIQLTLAVYAVVCAVATIAFIALSLASKGVESELLSEESIIGDRRPDFDPRAVD